jgi:putative DNA primase/helicase
MSYLLTNTANGQWDAIFSQLLPEVKQTTKHQPCPICGGKDRFRLFKDWIETGGAICNQCDAGNGFAWLMKFTGQNFKGALDLVNSVIDPSRKRLPREDFYEVYNRRQIELREIRKHGELEQRERQLKVAEIAQNNWLNALSGEHTYLKKKFLPKLNTKVSNNYLMIPLQDVEGVLWNVQSISKDGVKRFHKGGRVKGLFSCIGGELKNNNRVYISEGWSTAATIHLESGCISIAAMNAGNLESVAREVLRRFPGVEIVIAGDDDRNTKGNPGKVKATKAAMSVGAGVVFPKLCDGCSCSDFNDSSICQSSKRGCSHG